MVLFDYGFDSLINFVFNFPIMPPTTRRSAAFFLRKTFARVQIILYICSVDFTPFFI